MQTGGDSLLIVFDSIDGAVRCAVKVQQQVPIYDGDQSPDRAIRFRVGINIGDAIADGTDLHGDAVNRRGETSGRMSAGWHLRLAGGARSCAWAARSGVRGAWGAQSEEHRASGRGVRVAAWRHPGNPSSTPPDRSRIEEALPLPDKPSIAVLAFANMSGDPEQEYFSDGIAEDIITELSRIRCAVRDRAQFQLHLQGAAVDVQQVGRELGVRYVLEGSVRAVARACPGHRPAHRRRDRQSRLGRALRSSRWPTCSPCRTRSPSAVTDCHRARYIAC